ncbi:RHO1 GDP-GTP exchange protein 2 [Rhizophlyctis rosea]|nr:RHO1 GDP-GTP exchange protein 2 [Rhizophlyctis rosea]
MGNHYSFIKQGVCMDRTLICAVKSAALSTTIKVFEPVSATGGKKKGIAARFMKQDQLRSYQELFIPTEATSVDFLKRKLCVGCTKGFEIIDLEKLDTPMSLLDPNDWGLEFVTKREHIRPVSIFRVDNGDYLLCYSEFGFYINRLGGRARGEWIVHWAGVPTAFAYVPPYILAFEPNFIEIRHVDTGQLQQVIPTHNLRVLNGDAGVMHCVMDSVGEFQHVFRVRRVGG